MPEGENITGHILMSNEDRCEDWWTPENRSEQGSGDFSLLDLVWLTRRKRASARPSNQVIISIQVKRTELDLASETFQLRYKAIQGMIVRSGRSSNIHYGRKALYVLNLLGICFLSFMTFFAIYKTFTAAAPARASSAAPSMPNLAAAPVL